MSYVFCKEKLISLRLVYKKITQYKMSEDRFMSTVTQCSVFLHRLYFIFNPKEQSIHFSDIGF